MLLPINVGGKLRSPANATRQVAGAAADRGSPQRGDGARRESVQALGGAAGEAEHTGGAGASHLALTVSR